MCEVPPVGEVQPHDAVMGSEQTRVHCKVGRRPRQGLHVDTPLIGRQAKRFQTALLAQPLDLSQEIFEKEEDMQT